jgi:NADPH:quinone reductase-like Zn-dependent oxidoreductase
MKQIWIPKIGGPEVLELREAPEPEPKQGEVRIRVAASGINFADILARIGLYPDAPKLPTVVGYEVAGTIDSLGSGVSRFKEGDRVLAMTRFGGYSNVVTVPQAAVSPIPAGLSDEEAAAIPVNYLTAWLMLVHLGNVRATDTVLIHSVAGGVGQAAMQICQHHGATIIGTASANKHERVKRLGVTHCIDYRTEDFAEVVTAITDGRGVDIVLDAIGGKSFQKSYNCLAPLGRLFIFGVSSFSSGTKRSIPTAVKGLLSLPSFKPISLMNQNRGVFGVNLGHLWSETELLRNMLDDILNLMARGQLKPVVDRTFPFERAAEAHAYIQAHKNFGKVLLKP